VGEVGHCLNCVCLRFHVHTDHVVAVNVLDFAINDPLLASEKIRDDLGDAWGDLRVQTGHSLRLKVDLERLSGQTRSHDLSFRRAGTQLDESRESTA